MEGVLIIVEGGAKNGKGGNRDGDGVNRNGEGGNMRFTFSNSVQKRNPLRGPARNLLSFAS